MRMCSRAFPGRVVTGKTAKTMEMYNSYSNYIDAVNGYDLTLTLDSTIQAYAEQAIETGIQAYDVRNGGFCVVMDPKDWGSWPWPAPRSLTPTTTRRDGQPAPGGDPGGRPGVL